MTDRKTKIMGGGVTRSTTDEDHVAKIMAVREQLGVGEDIRVEDLSPLEFLRLQAERCKAEMFEATSHLQAAATAYAKAAKDYEDAERFYESGQRLAETTEQIMEENDEG